MQSDAMEQYSHFNPRSRKGSDPLLRPVGVEGEYFNPRSRKGSDPWLLRHR